MNKTAIKIGFQNGRATIALDEHETSAEEWNHLRKKAFSELRKDESIPGELIDLVEGFEERTPVQLYAIRDRDESSAEILRLGVKVIGKKPKRNVVQPLAEVSTATKTGNDENNDVMLASEALALFLRPSLRDLKIAEKQRENAPVRYLKFSSRSLIGEVALDLLDSCEVWNYAPSPELVSLFRELLNLQSYKLGASREFDAREQAISIIAQQPEVGIRALAKEVNVDATTVSRWRKDPDFNERVRRDTDWINSLKTSGRWDEMVRIWEKGELTEDDRSTLFSLIVAQRRWLFDP